MSSPGSGRLAGKWPPLRCPGTSVGSTASCSEPGRRGEPAPPPRPARRRPAARTSAGAARKKKKRRQTDRQTDRKREGENVATVAVLGCDVSRVVVVEEGGRETHLNKVS